VNPGPGEWLARLPGWEAASVSRLDGGLSHTAWKLDAGGRAAVLKIDREARSAPANSRATEAAAQAQAAGVGLAAPVLWHSSEGILTAWLEGESLSAAMLRHEAVIAEAGRALRRLHALPPAGFDFDLEAWASHYRVELEATGRFDASARRHWQRLVAADTTGPRVFSHNDPVPANLVVADSRIRFIDFEYAGDNSPWFDLAVLVTEARLDARRQALLLDAYLDGCDPPAGRLEDFVAIYRALVGLWSKLRLPVVP
jgi:aminoglycoside phosphotransferase (APT) family kinase protein